ncbi:hypothetical protein BEL07_21235 [Mycolicibacterium grossiae]|uniref:Uracil-DNA glycosylase n=1 Tax=Mycolicibacterium grossiae TaxID=1552759 RepID=A0A1E8Q171_9MYCO|nr:hypothetical protein BEL07_21235 [Mycolicibacterium grossiae]
MIEGFLLRTRRVMAHSLIREQAALITKLHKGEVTIMVEVNTKTDEESHRLQAEYPPEEALESLASRVRPLVLSSEPIYYAKMLDALEQVAGTDSLNEEIDLEWWHHYWRAVIDANLGAQAYWAATPSGDTTDRKLMHTWLDGDVIHAQSPRSSVIRDLSLDQRYYDAAPGIARICDRVIYTHLMLTALIEKGLLTVDPAVLSDPVVVTTTTVDEPVSVSVSDVGVPIPDDVTTLGPDALDPAVWRSPHQDLASLRREASTEGGASPVWLVDRAASQQRKAQLESYLAANVWNDSEDFICRTAGACRLSAEKAGASFYEAQSHMVGPCYDTQVDGKPYRVLVLPMETGEAKQHRTVEQRTEDVLTAGKVGFGQRNQHMRGVTFALRLAFGLPVDADIEHISFGDGSRAHFFDAYAMTNLLLCSAVDAGTANSRATGVMRKSCSRHLRATIDILQPSLVISQGARLKDTLFAALGVNGSIAANVNACALNGNSFVWVSLRHPSRGNWSSLKCTYLHEVVVPAIAKGRAAALDG